jgi:transposase
MLAQPAGPSSLRSGQQRALIAIAHTTLMICWHLLTEETTYTELGPNYLAGRDQPDRRRINLVRQLEQFGYHVELTTAA